MRVERTLAGELRRELRQALWAAGWFSVAYNILLLVSPLYMLQVYDRVLTSGSVDTLLLLSVLAIGLLGVFAAADSGRRRVLALIGRRLGERLEPELFRKALASSGPGTRLEATVGDLGRVQGVFSAGTIQPLFDAPFVPMFVALVFLIHPLLGAITLVGAIGLVVLAIVAERANAPGIDRSTLRDRAAQQFMSGISRQLATVRAMGMAERVATRWRVLRDLAGAESLEAGRVSAYYGGVSKSSRQVLQVVTLGAAAWLVLRQEISAGAIIASSILAGRALGPIDQAIGAWKPFLQARKSWQNLEEFLPVEALEPAPAVISLPRPDALLRFQDLVVAHPGTCEPLFAPIAFDLQGGQTLLVLGRSGQGKTTLLQAASGATEPLRGSVALGGRDVQRWSEGDRGAHIGYLSQYIDLLPGTVAENIARFRDDPPELAIVAAREAGCHEVVLSLPDGYDTAIGADAPLSAGQRQNIGLARAIYGDPVVLFLDEPTAHLDPRSVSALLGLLQARQEQGRIAVIASHDARLLGAATYVLELRGGRARLIERDAYVRALSAAVPHISDPSASKQQAAP